MAHPLLMDGYSAVSTKTRGNRFEHCRVERRQKAAAERIPAAPRDDGFERLQRGDRQENARADREAVEAFKAQAGCGQVDKINVNACRPGFADESADVDTATFGGAGFLHLAGCVHGYQERQHRRPV
jgi:hypothetical protein